MQSLSNEQRAQIVLWNAANGSYAATCSAVNRAFNVQVPVSSVRRLCLQFSRTANVSLEKSKFRKGCPNRIRTVRTVANEILLMQHLTTNPTMVQRKTAEIFGTVQSVIFKMTKDIKFHPYRLQIIQGLKEADYGERVHFSNWAVGQINEDPTFLDRLFMTDEARFSLNGTVVAHNCYYYSDNNPKYRWQKPITRQSVMVWAGLCSSTIIGPYFFPDGIRATAQSYLQMLREYVIPEMDAKGLIDKEMWFQQDGATIHTTVDVLRFLRNQFGENIISHRTDIPWPPRSPDLTAPDFFLWGYLKQKVYEREFETTDELKDIITEEMNAITPEMLHRVFHVGVPAKLTECLKTNGKQVGKR